MGNISVYFKHVDAAGNKTYYHEFIIWTNDEGVQTIIRGGPKARFGLGSASCSKL
jgi:hypothetical protein